MEEDTEFGGQHRMGRDKVAGKPSRSLSDIEQAEEGVLGSKVPAGERKCTQDRIDMQGNIFIRSNPSVNKNSRVATYLEKYTCKGLNERFPEGVDWNPHFRLNEDGQKEVEEVEGDNKERECHREA